MKSAAPNTRLPAVALLAVCMSYPGLAWSQAFFTSFEFEDLSGQFDVTDGDPPVTATFSGGQAKVVGNLSLYHSGFFAFMVDSGDTATVSLATPVNQINVFLRDENGSVGSVLTVFDANGSAIGSFNGTDADWVTVDVLAEADSGGISSFSIQNNGTGYAVIDDLTLDAAVTPIDDPIPEPIAQAGQPVKLVTVASGLTAPNWGIPAPGDYTRLFVTDQPGILWAIDLINGDKTVFLDTSNRQVPPGAFGPGSFDERGLLGVAFHPDYQVNGLLYTYTSEPTADFTTLFPAENHRSVITEWRVPHPYDRYSVVDPASARMLLTVDQPQFNHDGGAIGIGPDGMLYIALGDGGGGDDEGIGHEAQGNGNGQDPSNVLGTVLRIDPTGSNSANGRYGIPADNPYVGDGPPFGGAAGCADGVCDEIFAFGFRNPFRFSFDRKRGDLYLADVGQNDIEEIDIVTAGGNYGWRIREGSFCFNPNGAGRGFVTGDVCGTADLIDPVAEYDHDEGISIIGGFVYRGKRIPWLRGHYVFGDFSQNFFGHNGRLFFLKTPNIVRKGVTVQSDIAEFRLVGQDDTGLSVLGFAEDARGEIYVLGNTTGTPFGDTGVVQKITSAR